MEIIKYGVTLKRLTYDKIELVRNWRNDPKISQYMEFRDHITPKMQEEWFKSINNDSNYYFIVHYDNTEIGLVNIKNIDFNKKCAEPGIFIYEDKYLNSDVGFRCALCNMDFAFEYLQLDVLCGHILADNKRALRFNKALGYVLVEGEEGKNNQCHILTRDKYFECREKIVALLR